MKKILQNIAVTIFLFSLLFISCNEEKNSSFSFFEKEEQTVQEKNFLGLLALQDSLLLSEEYGTVYASALDMNDDSFFLRDRSILRNVHIIDKHSMEMQKLINVPEGRGPGELTSIAGMVTSDNYIYFYNEDLMKIQKWDHKGEYIEEFILDHIQPHKVSVHSDSMFFALSPMSLDLNHVFHALDSSGEPITSFGKINPESYNPLMYSGYINNDDDYFYYAGFSEHILQKWDFEGNLVYSKTTIEDFPGELNYSAFEGNDERVFQYLETGMFSAVGTTIFENYWIVMQGGYRNEDPYRQYMEIYDKRDGNYLATFQLPHYAGFGSVLADKDYIYTLHSIDDEVWLGIYDNILPELLPL